MNLIVIIGVAVVIIIGLLAALLLRSPGRDENQLSVADIQARLEKETEAKAPADH